MKSKEMSSSKLRILLIAGLFLTVGAGVALFGFGYQLLAGTAHETSEVAQKASESSDSLQRLKTTGAELAKNTEAVDKASRIVADSKSYVYQDQIIEDLNRIASGVGITLFSIDFADPTVSGGASAPAAAAATPTPAPGAPAAAATPAPTAAIKTMSASIKISDKVEYAKMLQFLYAIEQNLTKMSVEKITLRDAEGGVNGKPGVVTDQLTVKVYVR